MIEKINQTNFNNIFKFKNFTTKPTFRGKELKADTFEKSSKITETRTEEQADVLPWEEIRELADYMIKKPKNCTAQIQKINKYGQIAIKKGEKIIDEFKKDLKAHNPTQNNKKQKEAEWSSQTQFENRKSYAYFDGEATITEFYDEYKIGKISYYDSKENSYLVIDYKNGVKVKSINDEITQYYEGHKDFPNGFENWENRIAFQNGKVTTITQDGSYRTFEDKFSLAKREVCLGIDRNGNQRVEEYYSKNLPAMGMPCWNKVYYHN